MLQPFHRRRIIFLQREVAQLKKDVDNFSFRSSPRLAARFGTNNDSPDFPVPVYPLRETPGGINAEGNPVMVYVVSPIKPSEPLELKQTLPKLHENSQEVVDRLQMWMGPHLYTYTELMYRIFWGTFLPQKKKP